ncbi:hypothetical protein L596_029974 [Steinernema carpocapsae]|uniref:Aminopeptidase n=1 Tax=Steinernema carpocapsae TaxID=34508 RepID=A0A4V5ZX62_STECR|nr:hypothetical protein L596_029974 [Steinernema carpocapsae]
MEPSRVAVILFAALTAFFIISWILLPISSDERRPDADRQWPQRPETWPKPLPGPESISTPRNEHQAPDQDEFEDFRLSKNVVPIRYMIDLDISMKMLQYNGTVVIKCQALETTKFIVSEVSQEKHHFLMISLREAIPEKSHFIISVGFYKQLPYKAFPGAYYSNYTNEAFKKEDFYLATAFEQNFARAAFPCFDEPALKSTFEMRISVDSEYDVFFNSKEVRTTMDTWWSPYLSRTVLKNTAKKTVQFGPSPRMSTYLVAFTIGKFECLETDGQRLVPVRMCKLVGRPFDLKKPLNRFNLSVDYYADLFERPHDVAKIDVVAVPFHLSAIEQWGLITIAERIAFANESNEDNLRYSWGVASHEIAHFYFGNLVTMKWWNHYWIKEGMTTLLEYMFMDNVVPQLQNKEHSMEYLNLVLRSQEMNYNSLPIQADKVQEDIFGWYHNVSNLIYKKGGAVLRMLKRYLDKKHPDVFMKALKVFLTRHQFEAVEDKDFWNVFSEISGEDIGAMTIGWMTQKGFPMVEVQLTEDKEIRKLTLTQKRFLVDKESDPDHTLWDIPIEFYYWNANCTNACKGMPQSLRLRNSTKSFFLNPAKDYLMTNSAKDFVESFPIFNPDQYGYYIVKYDQNLFTKVVKMFPTFDLIDRIMILSDTSYLVQAGEYKIDQFLDIITQCIQEPSAFILRLLDRYIHTLKMFLLGQESKNAVWEFNEAINTIFNHLSASQKTSNFLKLKETNNNNVTKTSPIDDPCLWPFKHSVQRHSPQAILTKPNQVIEKYFKMVKEGIISKHGLETDIYQYGTRTCEEDQLPFTNTFGDNFEIIKNRYDRTHDDFSVLATVVRTVFIKGGDIGALEEFQVKYNETIKLLEPYMVGLKGNVEKTKHNARAIKKWREDYVEERRVESHGYKGFI